MDRPFGPRNWFCSLLGHRYRHYTDMNGVQRATCWLDGTTVPPFPRVPQSREDYDAWKNSPQNGA